MFSLRFYARYDLYNTPTTNIPHKSSPKSCSITNAVKAPILFLFLASNSKVVAGTPLQPDQYGLLKKRDASSDSSNMSPKIVVAIAIGAIVFLLLGAAVVSYNKKRFLRGTLNSFSVFGSGSAVGGPMGGPTSAPRELTAEQLAGTINGDGNGNAAARTTRRARRPRRTPSQMSVTSLPAYNKEPGEEELVIFRGRDMEDATMPTATAMTSLDEENDGSSFSHDDSQPSRYSPMPTSPNNMPLLQDDGDLSLQSLPDILPQQGSRQSLSSRETSSLMRTDSNLPDESPDPRGQAPAYYEVVDSDDIQNTLPTTNVRRQPSNASTSPGPNPNRRSGFRTLLNRMSMASGPQIHTRNESVNSTFSSNLSHTLEPTNSRVSGHRPTHSGSGSLLSVSMFRTLSRQKSNHTLNSNRLNSPSLISLNSISSPLTHTATRTEFTYPKTGPTAEQLKMISSRDSIVRFGVPYGADAIAYASSSRLDLIPPPEFDSTVEPPQVPRSGVSAGPSRLRSTSNLERSSEAAATPATEISSTPVDNSAPSSSSPSPSPQNTDENKDTNSTTNVSTAAATIPAPVIPAENASSEPVHQKPSSEPGSSPAGVAKDTENAGSSLPHSNSNSTSPSSRPTQQQHVQPVSEFGKLSIPPPSSYIDHTASSARSESRASIFTYATAAESLSLSASGRSRSNSTSGQDNYDTATEDEFYSEAEAEFDSAPSTPRLGGQHGLELTDATIVPQDSSKRDTIIASSSSMS